MGNATSRDMLSDMDKKLTKILLSVTVGIITMLIVYIGLQSTENVPLLSRFPLTSDTAISVIIKKENLTQAKLTDFRTKYVYIKGNGSIFESSLYTNAI